MNRLLFFAVIILSIAFVYTYNKYNNKTEYLTQNIASLRGQISELKKRIEGIESSRKSEDTSDNPLTEIFKKIPRTKIKTEDEILAQMKDDLGMSDSQLKDIKTVLLELREKRKGIFDTAKEKNEFPFAPQYRDMMVTAIKEARNNIKNILNEEQFNLMVEKNYDLQLRIRIPLQVSASSSPK